MSMVGKIYITRHGYDPEQGRHVKDPYLGPCPTLGACQPDIRNTLEKGWESWVHLRTVLPDQALQGKTFLGSARFRQRGRSAPAFCNDGSGGGGKLSLGDPLTILEPNTRGRQAANSGAHGYWADLRCGEVAITQ